MIGKEEIEEARELLGEYVSGMTDEEITELLCQIKKMVALVVEFIEKETT